jgi:DNA replication protein DnaC
LYLKGKPGTGKTRASWWLIKREHFKGVLAYGLTCTEFARFAGEQWHSESKQRALAEEALDKCRRVKLLLLDDLGKQKMTERAELELFDLLENRTQNLLPTIITTNATSPQLLAMLSEDRGNAILRRIKDFNTIVNCDK